jgi:hypothetical protein
VIGIEHTLQQFATATMPLLATLGQQIATQPLVLQSYKPLMLVLEQVQILVMLLAKHVPDITNVVACTLLDIARSTYATVATVKTTQQAMHLAAMYYSQLMVAIADTRAVLTHADIAYALTRPNNDDTDSSVVAIDNVAVGVCQVDCGSQFHWCVPAVRPRSCRPNPQPQTPLQTPVGGHHGIDVPNASGAVDPCCGPHLGACACGQATDRQLATIQSHRRACDADDPAVA